MAAGTALHLFWVGELLIAEVRYSKCTEVACWQIQTQALHNLRS